VFWYESSETTWRFGTCPQKEAQEIASLRKGKRERIEEEPTTVIEGQD